MTRHMPPTRRSRVRLVLEVDCDRDESTLTFGLLSARGVNQREAGTDLAAQILALAMSPAAQAGLAAEASAEHAVYLAEQATLGTDEALRRSRLRAHGISPDAQAIDP